MKYVIKTLDLLSVFRFLLVTGALVGLATGASVSSMAVYIASLASESGLNPTDLAGAGLLGGLIAGLVAAAGYIATGLVATLVYNLLSGFMGGIEVDLESKKK